MYFCLIYMGCMQVFRGKFQILMPRASKTLVACGGVPAISVLVSLRISKSCQTWFFRWCACSSLRIFQPWCIHTAYCSRAWNFLHIHTLSLTLVCRGINGELSGFDTNSLHVVRVVTNASFCGRIEQCMRRSCRLGGDVCDRQRNGKRSETLYLHRRRKKELSEKSHWQVQKEGIVDQDNYEHDHHGWGLESEDFCRIWASEQIRTLLRRRGKNADAHHLGILFISRCQARTLTSMPIVHSFICLHRHASISISKHTKSLYKTSQPGRLNSMLMSCVQASEPHL